MNDVKIPEGAVAKVDGVFVTQVQMEEAFAKVRPAGNWKNPIDAEVVFASSFDRLLLESAITYFTGSVAELEVVKLEAYRSTYRVRAVGYYAAIGA